MKKMCYLIFATFVSSIAFAEDISYIDSWEKYKKSNPKMIDYELEQAQLDLEKGSAGRSFKPIFFAKEMVKICSRSREGMAVDYFSPTQYSETMQSFNRQVKKKKGDWAWMGDYRLGAIETLILKSSEYSVQRSIINGQSFTAGRDECNKWMAAVQMAEFGL